MQKSFTLPLGISEEDAPLEELRQAKLIELLVPKEYVNLIQSPELNGEVFAIQRILSVSRLGIPIVIKWSQSIGQRLPDIARIQPLIAVLILLQGVKHSFEGIEENVANTLIETAQKGVRNHRLIKDLFSPSQVLLCDDSHGFGRPEQLYLPKGGALRPRSHFETLMQEVLSAELKATGDTAKRFEWATNLGVILGELFENTDLHGMKALDGSRFTFNAMRGMLFKRIKISVPLRNEQHQVKNVEKDCLEVSVFDSGIGYFRSYSRTMDPQTIQIEWQILHKCLERHFDETLSDGRSAHRALGLAEVLRSLQTLGGRIEVRTGRTFGYRTFIEGQLQAQMIPTDSTLARFRWPRPRLLDATKQVVAVPTTHEETVGSAIRVIIPLS